VAVHVTSRGATYRNLVERWRHLDRDDIFFVAVEDHLVAPDPDADEAQLDCWTLLAAMAVTTSVVRVASLVTAPGLRSPLAVAKAAATVQEISEGRLVLGLGAGWYRPEFTAADRPFLPYGQRLGQVRETVALCRGEPSASLKPGFEEGAPCVLIGTAAERGLSLVAEAADIWVGQGSPRSWATLSATLSELMDRNGRSTADIIRSTDLEPAEIEQLPGFREEGLDLVVLVVPASIPLPDLDAILARASRLMA
jgi:alkanesulfonate monooxygenase SsuD/methylene tetrahydromethanopterin reductase-like flavin-dependent oxidoreductase (luciferase family)